MRAYHCLVRSLGYVSPLVFLCAFSSVGVCTASHGTQDSPKQPLNARDAPRKILTACASYAQGLVPEERAFLMVRIATAAAANRIPQSTEWATQAFAVSSDLPKTWSKIALQKNALVALAKTRPMEALRLLGTLPVPPPPPSNVGTRLDEDPRADAARAIFESAYRNAGEKSLVPMLQVSAYLGSTGEYPFAAWGDLLPKIAKEHPATFNEAISTAIRLYRDADDRIISQDEDYYDMVSAIHGAADRGQMKTAVATAIDRLSAEKAPKNETYVEIAGPNTAFDSQSKALLYRWLPLVQQFDSADYEDLMRRLGVKDAAAKKDGQHAGAEILGDPKNIGPQVQQRVHDRLQEQIVEQEATDDPDRAIGASVSIISMALRADALAKGAIHISAKAMAGREKLLAESRRDLNEVKTKNADYLMATADLAGAYGEAKMPRAELSLARDGLNEGAEILDESADAQPNTPTMLLKGYDSIAKLTAIGMHLDPAFTLASVQSLNNLPLKVNLLVDIAEAIAANPES